jgi:DNA-binding response OmpR family regulator
VTVLGSLLDKVKELGYGTDDYVIKPFKGEELLVRIEALLRVKRLHDELKRAGEELRQSYKSGGLAELEQAMTKAHAQVGYDVSKTVEFP